MPEPKRIRIRPLAVAENADGAVVGDARLSIEVNGRVLPLARYVEIVGEIVAPGNAGFRRDAPRRNGS